MAVAPTNPPFDEPLAAVAATLPASGGRVDSPAHFGRP